MCRSRQQFSKICMNSARRAFGEDLVVDAAKERFVHEIGRLDVGREDHQHLERQVELLTGLQRRGSRRGSRAARSSGSADRAATALAAEVVDDQHAAVGLRLHRRAVETREAQ